MAECVGGAQVSASALLDTVLAQISADVMAIHSAQPRHLAHVSPSRAAAELQEIILLEGRDGAAFCLGEGDLGTLRLIRDRVTGEREHVVDGLGRVGERGVSLPSPLIAFRTPNLGELLVRPPMAFVRLFVFRAGVVKPERMNPAGRGASRPWLGARRRALRTAFSRAYGCPACFEDSTDSPAFSSAGRRSAWLRTGSALRVLGVRDWRRLMKSKNRKRRRSPAVRVREHEHGNNCRDHEKSGDPGAHRLLE